MTKDVRKENRMELKGQIEDIIFTNEANSYTVCTMMHENEVITCTGYLPFVNVGDVILANGNFVRHATYGEQFKVDTFEKQMPNTIDEIERYLGSGIIKGIGPATSRKIIDKFGEDTIYVLQFEPYKLSQIKGITSEKAGQIGSSFNEIWELWKLVMFLNQYGIGTTNANRVYKELGVSAIEKIKENPYILLQFLYGVDFKNVDQMALTLGVEHDSEHRIASGIKYVMSLSTKNGNTCVSKEKLLEYVSQILCVELSVVENEFTALCYAKELYLEDGFVFLSDYYVAEENVAKKMLLLANTKAKYNFNLDKKMKEYEKELEIELSEEQKEAVKEVFKRRLTIITGGPGTGKTTIIKMLIKLLKREGMEVALCAPTGRAAKRITETTGEEAKTLHRLLEIGKTEENNLNIYAEVTKIKQDVVIVDEMSMVDIVLMNFLSKALKEDTMLILIGDSDQLPSVGPGSVLKDLITSGEIPTKKLTQIYRQAAESQIITNAHKINEGNEEIDLNKKNGDFFFIRESNILEQIIELIQTRLPKMRTI
ncbi:MAG: AAA family ATPase [Bacilli bacterium]|nr:AAA family ATPase [Bacilli bacterium]